MIYTKDKRNETAVSLARPLARRRDVGARSGARIALCQV